MICIPGNRMTLVSLFILVFLFYTRILYGQDEELNEREEIKDEFVIFYGDSLSSEDSIQFTIDKDSYESTESFFDTLKKKAKQSTLSQKLYDLLIVNDKKKIGQNKSIDDYSTPFDQYSGKPINRIRIRQLDVFGKSITDTSMKTDQWYEEAGNWIHMPTHQSIIKDNLLFSSGDTLDPSLLRDNGRVLRDLQYLKDARLIVQPSGSRGDSVDVIVVTQDVWAKGFDVNLGSISSGEMQVFDNNFLGFGHKIQTNVQFDYFENSNPGIEAYYNLSNIRGSFINTRLYYLDAFKTRRYGLQFSREFYSYRTRLAGGGKMYRTSTTRNIVQEDTTLNQVDMDYINHDFWMGYAFPLNWGEDFFRNRNRLVFSARYKNDRFFEGPLITRRYNYQFHNNQMVLGKVSLSRENYYKSSLIYDFGRTEDIPVGDLVSYTFGWEMDEFFRRFYSGVNYRHGKFIDNFGYLSTELGAGGFLYQNRIEQGAVHFRTNYISKLFHTENMKLRQFFGLDYSVGYNRFPEETLRLDKSRDIRGFPNYSELYGNKKLVFRSETVGFTNIYYYGFRLAFYGFCDFGFLGPSREFILQNPIQSGFGIGMRLRNENFVFNTFQIRLGYYPSLTHDNSFLVNVSGEKSLKPVRYTPKPPQVIDF
ncbi:MAG: hypothetical protein KGY70_06685 [Bacteroidales bacterium]|nr:hypothetical protein [Bacteroidales bacterium]